MGASEEPRGGTGALEEAVIHTRSRIATTNTATAIATDANWSMTLYKRDVSRTNSRRHFGARSSARHRGVLAGPRKRRRPVCAGWKHQQRPLAPRRSRSLARDPVATTACFWHENRVDRAAKDQKVKGALKRAGSQRGLGGGGSKGVPKGRRGATSPTGTGRRARGRPRSCCRRCPPGEPSRS